MKYKNRLTQAQQTNSTVKKLEVQWTCTTIYNIYSTTLNILDCSKNAPVQTGTLLIRAKLHSDHHQNSNSQLFYGPFASPAVPATSIKALKESRFTTTEYYYQ